MKRTCIALATTLLCTAMVAVGPASPAQAGLFDCIKPNKWSGYTKLRTAFNKDPQVKTSDDWFKAYVFARIYTGSSKCFNSKDVAMMRKWVNAYNQACLRDPSWNNSCKYFSGTSTLSDWVYEGYK